MQLIAKVEDVLFVSDTKVEIKLRSIKHSLLICKYYDNNENESNYTAVIEKNKIIDYVKKNVVVGVCVEAIGIIHKDILIINHLGYIDVIDIAKVTKKII